MKTLIIKKKMSNTGTIYDLASAQYDREIKFRGGTKYAVVFPAYFGNNLYKTFRSEDNAIKYSTKEQKNGFYPAIIDNDGNEYCVEYDFYGSKLVPKYE